MSGPGPMPRRLDDVRDLVAARLPGRRVGAVRLLGQGLDNVAYEVGGELIVRFSREADPVRRAALTEREARVLAAVAALSPLPVPVPAFAVPEQGCLAYPKLPGVPLADMPRRWRETHGAPIAEALGDLLAVLHADPVEPWAELVGVDDQPPAGWLREAAETYRAVAGQVPAVHRRAVEAFLDAAPPRDGHRRVFSHNDLGIEHVLVDPAGRAVTGVIDWSDAAVCDPAYDLGLVYRDLGPAALRAALGRRRDGAGEVAALAVRAVFYARCSVFEDLAYGLHTGRDAYTANSLTSLAWLFAA
ncbi:hypothetical protein Cs7R123_03270 [Catellatospora sp. TT07R-123]|uniref:phosphotransferase family protein n=1 Tax=Catellatospora sp. TT07R-123 TaxID=2733863 RepID=UPI001B1C8D6C|nr:phosphotransferase [Catellatospora sp. TT07R-123]GHJ42985.1 hypothetical protein Cs7R123_03270 [Catellatospora sp. TT07R-123]